ncbi:hypothetical protein, partial [Kaarinaea lacus]
MLFVYFQYIVTLTVPVSVLAATDLAIFDDIEVSEFDHSSTGFTLDGQHTLIDCEKCHLGGVFDELPRQCAECHDNIFTVGTNSNHIPVFEACDICHTTQGFESSAMTTVMDHSILVSQPCMGCHDGVTATGKPPNHIPTVLDCDACHNVNSWLVSSFDHSSVSGQPCISCHNGIDASGKHASHIPSSETCDACHRTTAWLPPTQVDHSEVTGPCADCHNGFISGGKPANHINTTMFCENCHAPAPATWSLILQVDHDHVLGSCSSCHDNVIATGKHASHVTTNQECDTCHSTKQWIPAAVDHSSFAGNCISCHNNIDASGKSAGHISASDVCDSCHEKFPAQWTPVDAAAVDHAQVIGTCASCHNNAVATGKPATHINTTDLCDACHAAGPIPFHPAALGVDH